MYRVVTILALFATGCASGARAGRACDQLPAGYLLGETVFRNCEVDEQARVISQPPPDLSRLEPMLTGVAGCYQAEFALVVSELGEVVPGSAKLIRANDERYATMIGDNVESVRFQPAIKNGIPVRQVIVHHARHRYLPASGAQATQQKATSC